MRRPLLFTAGLLALACSNPTAPPQPAAFDRPESIAFFCWDFQADGEAQGVVGAPVPLSACAPNPPDDESDPADPARRYALHALVTQTATGEVAPVRLSGSTSRGVIDTDVRVPGFTFAAVGEVPIAIAISETDPKHVFVANRGSSSIHVIATADFRKGTGASPEEFTARDLGLPSGSRPNAMVLSPDMTALILALPGAGQLARVPITGEGELGTAELFDLGTTLPDPVDLTALGEDPLGAPYRFTCPEGLVQFEPPVIPPRDPVVRGSSPEPWAIVYDAASERLLISDRSLPIIHVVDPVTMVEDAPIPVSVPTRLLALTPFVPATIDATEPTERYLYAIDETDQSVLAVDLSDPTRPTYGAVLPVSITEPVDRLPLRGELARALAVVTPGYDDDPATPVPDRSCAGAPDEQEPGGTALYGVFLTVGTLDGSIRFFDVHDLDVACRGSGCNDNAEPDDQLVAIGRHRPRIGATLELDERTQITPEPSWTTEAGGVEVEEDGTTSAPSRVPNLVSVTCDAPLARAFPVDGEDRICAVIDPWASRPERFTVAYEGQIPFTSSTGGNFAGDDRLEARSDFCGLGVIGSEQVPDSGSLSGYAGDVLAITGDLPPSILMSDDDDLLDRCETLTERTLSGETTPILIPIRRAFSNPEGARATYPGQLELADTTVDGVSLAEVRECFPELLEFEIRARGAFVVQSSSDGFRHAIVRGDGGGCEVDPARVAEGRVGRAFFEETYDSPRLRFRLGARPDNMGRSTLEIEVGDVPPPLFIDVSSIGGSDLPSLLTNLVYNDVDERLYAVDQAVQGLVRIQLNPSLGIAQTFR